MNAKFLQINKVDRSRRCRFLTELAVAFLGLSSVGLLQTPAAHAAVGGDVYNGTNITISIGRLHKDHKEICTVWNKHGGTRVAPINWKCSTRGLKSRKWDPYFYDADIFRISSSHAYYVHFYGGNSIAVRVGRYTKIGSAEKAKCYVQGGAAHCYVTRDFRPN
jgi:hypothetical protein